ncbi:MAG: response regulator [Rhodospirillaceae bacterium]|nr:response regulator [Rhodospirillaceae bacterium]
MSQAAAEGAGKGSIFVVDDDAAVRDSLAALLEAEGFAVEPFESARAFLDGFRPKEACCVIADIRMPDMDGLELQEEIIRRGWGLPVVIITGHGDVPLAVRAMKAGAVDFIEKPFDDEVLRAGIERGLAQSRRTRGESAAAQEAETRIAQLTAREREVMEHLVAGRPNKVIAHRMDISPRTVEVHRGRVMEKLQAHSLSDLVRMALAAKIEISAAT